MQPCKVFEDDRTTLYQGDAWQILQTLADESIDGIITDPPYSTGALTLSGKQADPGKKYQNSSTKKTFPEMLGDGKDQRGFLTWATMWLTECWRVTKNGAPVLIFTDWRQLPTVTDALQAAGFFWRGIVVWNKKCGRPMRGEFKRDSEFIVYGCKGKYSPLMAPSLFSNAQRRSASILSTSFSKATTKTKGRSFRAALPIYQLTAFGPKHINDNDRSLQKPYDLMLRHGVLLFAS